MSLEGYTRFLLECAKDEQFTVDRMMNAIEKVGGHLGFIDRIIYRYAAIPQTKTELLARVPKLEFIERQPHCHRRLRCARTRWHLARAPYLHNGSCQHCRIC